LADTSLVIALDQVDTLNLQSRDERREVLQKVINHLEAIKGGSKRAKRMQVFADGTDPVRAFQILDLTSDAATNVVEINGVPFTALSGTVTTGNNEYDIQSTDGAGATSLAASINASTTAGIQYVVTAAAVGADTLTASTAVAGTSFSVTLADGTKHKFTGAEGAVTLTEASFSVDTGNTETATSIAAQVNAYAPFSGKLSATSSSAVVLFSTVDGEAFTLTGTASVLAESNSGKLVIRAAQMGKLGNALTVKNKGLASTGTVTYSSSSGAQTVVINGVTVYSATGASDSANAIAAAAAINASTNALIQNRVRALVRSAVVHVFSIDCGLIGNTVTLSVTGTGATASVARLAGGTLATSEGAQATVALTVSGADGGTYRTTINGVNVDVTGTNGDDSATAATIVAGVNASTSALVRGHVTATNSSGVVTLTAVRGGLAGNMITSAVTGTGYTAATARLANGAAPTVVTPPSERLTSGSGGDVTPVTVTL
jgi:hypothetical protein